MPLGVVKRTLSEAGLRPQKVRLMVTLATKPTPSQVNYCAAEAVGQPSATSLDADGGRAIVMVFTDGHTADEWRPMPECGAKPLRVRNVVVVATHGSLSEQLRDAIRQLD